ncbi:M48 family metallopeptidase [Rheinheimera sp. UJ51]|uniref:M48 family metallopeptidase n=1 Tax=Rheinheimera sp. UJ51 TaxID=2892446 RepID=UPI001E54C426|nr:SprT family zinc-dependent metalloprotease [Rheinheimera sp. UJ51]MCC5452117.1 M48 family metallopeptidase [Rheinheimera sp. UJ51]
MAILSGQTALPFNYQVIYSRRRSVQLAIKAGQLTIRAPKGTSSQFISALLARKQQWILLHLARTEAEADSVVAALDRHEILVSGQSIPFCWQLAAKADVVMTERQCKVSIPTRVKPERRALYLNRQLQEYFVPLAEQYFQQAVASQAQLMGCKPKAIRIGNWQRKWGFCNSLSEVGFNWRLMQAPTWVADYVVVHELAHLTHMNHSNAFWQRVAKFSADYRLAEQWLKQHQRLLL